MREHGDVVRHNVLSGERPGSSPPSDIINFSRARIAGFKTPKSVDFIEALPRNASGKILRCHLRDPYWAGKDRQVN
jgi:acyl-CoA synthetase (AMP-forming)/AMP-acid ligase II